MQKPEKYTLKEFILYPLRDSLNVLKFKILKKLGWWYCDYCEQPHSPKTIKYLMTTSYIRQVKSDGRASDVCSLLIENCGVEK